MSFFDRVLGGRGRAAERERQARLRAFRAEIEREREKGNRPALERLRGRPVELGLTEDDAALELELVEGLLEVLALEEAASAGAPLPAIVSSHRALGDEACHFQASAFRPDVPNDAGGKILFTPRRLIYLGSPALTLGWAHVRDVTDVERDLVIRARPERRLVFRCNSYVDALRGAWIGRALCRRGSTPPSASGAPP